jgi:5'-deoxynucleotidase YfbR-like HD superfamily hydrolase
VNTNTATSILVHDPETSRSWYLDTAAPTRDSITLGQLGLGLESIKRFGGYTTRPITVAEHSLRVGRFARTLVSVHSPDWTPLLAAAADLAGLIHDTPEAMTGLGDVLRPAKTDGHRETEARAYAAVVDHIVHALHRARTGTPLLSGAEVFDWRADRIRQALAAAAVVVHTADNLALYYEAMLWQPGARDWAPHVVSDPIPDVLLPLVWPRAGESWAASVRAACNEVAAAARAL